MCDIIGTFDRCPFFVNENIGQKILSKDLENIVKKWLLAKPSQVRREAWLRKPMAQVEMLNSQKLS